MRYTLLALLLGLVAIVSYAFYRTGVTADVAGGNTGKIVVTAFDEVGVPVINPVISVTDTRTGEAKAIDTPNELSEYVTTVPVGDYVVNASATGYTADNQTVTVDRAKEEKVVFYLTAE